MKLGMTTALTGFLMLALMLPSAAVAQSANLIVNGGFDLSPAPGPPGWTTYGKGSRGIPRWIVTRGSVDLQGPNWQTADGGHNSVDVDGNEPGGIAQSFETVRGRQYAVSFALAGNPCEQPLKRVLVTVARVANRYQFDASHTSTSQMGWRTIRFLFTAVAYQSTLTFTSLDSGSSCGPEIDAVSVVPMKSYKPVGRTPPVTTTGNYPNINGNWVCSGPGCGSGLAVVYQNLQNPAIASLRNEKGATSRAHFVSYYVIVADDWQGGLRGSISPSITTISWANGTMWTRVPGGGNPGGGGGAGGGSLPAGFKPCFVNAGAYAAAGADPPNPCFGHVVGATIYVVLVRPMTPAPGSLVFKTVYSSGPAAVGPVPLTPNGSFYTLIAPQALCVGPFPHTWNIWLVDTAGKLQGEIGRFTAQC